MRGTTVNLDKKTISCQGGYLWSDVDYAAAEHGIATLGGTVNHTGIGGLTLGGGYGYLTATHGMVVDNLVSVRIVLANGSIVKASETQNPDLFWAIRGAGHNFGVVVEFEYKLHPQGDVWCGILAFATDKLRPILEFLNAHGSAPQPNSPAFMLVTAQMLAVMVFHNGTEEAGKEIFKPLLDIGPVLNTTSYCPYKESNPKHNGGSPHGPCRRSRGGVFMPPLRPEFVEECPKN
jgi:hypothetical protein